MTTLQLDLLRCPLDRGGLAPAGPADAHGDPRALRCVACGTAYPVREGIVDMLAHAGAEGATEDQGRRRERDVRDREAEIYDRRVSEAVVAAEMSGVRRLLGLEREHVLVDLGCGTGRMTRELARTARIVVGVDHSIDSLRVFRDRLTADERERVVLVRGDLYALPLADGGFDRAVSHSVFQHFADLPESRRPLLEASRVLRPGGRLVLGIYHFSELRARLARVWPGFTYGGGYHREGVHTGDVFYRRYRVRELNDMLGAHFEVERTRGARIVPRFLLERFGMVAVAVELFLQRLPMAKTFGYYVMTLVRKRHLALALFAFAGFAPEF